jgi:RND family efflux transporter MFP subunit
MRRTIWTRTWRAARVSAAALAIAGGAVPAAAAELDCLMQPREIVTVSAPAEGVLARVMVDRGDVVQAGSVLAELESSLERTMVTMARARAAQDYNVKSNQVRLDFGERRFVRTDEMFRKSLVPLKELDEAETAKILAVYGLVEANEQKHLLDLDLERAQATLELRTVKSPISGVVVERLRAPGELASREHPVVRIARLDPLRVEVFVPMALYGQVTVGQRAVVVPEPPLNRPLEARVTVVDKVADAASSTPSASAWRWPTPVIVSPGD